MLFNNLKTNRGLTLIEVLISISILAMLSLLGLWYFSRATKAQVLEKDRQALVAILQEARSLAIASKKASLYGVRIEQFQAILFEGGSYISSDPNNKYQPFNSAVHRLSYSLNGGGENVIFSRLTGETNNFGTITLSLINDNSSSVIVTIKKTGVIE